MIVIFIDQIEEVIPNAETALHSDDFLVLSNLMHKIRPSVEGMGIVSIIEGIKKLEKITKEDFDKDNISDIFFQIKSTLFSAVEQLKEEI